MIRLRVLVAVIVMSVGSVTGAQGTRADYDRSAALPGRWQGKVTHGRVEPKWVGGERFCFRSDVGEGRWEFVRVDCEAGTRGVMFDHAKLADALAKAAGAKFEAGRLALENVELAADAKSMEF